MKHIKGFVKWRLVEGVESNGYMEGAVEWLYNMIVSSMLSLHEDELAEGTLEEFAEEFGISIVDGGDRVILERREAENIGYYSGGITTETFDLDWVPGASFYMELVPIISDWNPELDFLNSIGTVDFGDHIKGIRARIKYRLLDLKRGGWQLEKSDSVELMFNSGVELDEEEFASFIVDKLLDYGEWFSEEQIRTVIGETRAKNR